MTDDRTPPHGGVTVTAFPRERRHTALFLRRIRPFSPVFLDTEVDMTAVRAHRAATHQAAGIRHSTVTYVLHAAARVIARHPEANAALGGLLRTRVARYAAVNGKVTFDKRIAGRRVVLSVVLPDLHHAGLDDIQQQIARIRDADPAVLPDFAGVRALHRLPAPVAAAAFRAAVAPLRKRADAFGTFAVTSLGHAPVDGFQSVGGTTVTLGLGRVLDRPVARDGQIAVAPLMRLNLAFDHRVIDGAEAADVLTGVKDALEGWPLPEETETPEAPAAAQLHATVKGARP